MDKVTEFKQFIKTKPHVVPAVQEGRYSWQQVYELYDIYGTEHSLFKTEDEIKEAKKQASSPPPSQSKQSGGEYFNQAVRAFQGIDMDKVMQNLQSVHKILTVFSELSKNTGNDKDPIRPGDFKRRNYRKYND